MKKLILLTCFLVFSLNINAQNGKYVEANGVKIYYEIHGEGEPLLLLHGFSLSHKFWEPWIKDLPSNHQLIIPDLRGHGNSSNPSNTFTHELSAKDMYGLMDALNITKFKAMGHSSGAMILTHMATIDTTRITKMILIGATSFFPEEARVIQRQVSYDTQDENWLALLKTHHPGGENQIRQLLIQFRNFAETYNDMNFTAPYLSTIQSKTLIIHGDRDQFFPVNIPVNSYRSIPNSYLWIVPNEGHIPFGLLGNESIWFNMFIKVVDDFFNNNWN